MAGPADPAVGSDYYERAPAAESDRSGPDATSIASDRARPLAPRTETRDRRWVRAAVIGAAIAVVVGLTAGAAIMLKHQPSDFAQPVPTSGRPGDTKASSRNACRAMRRLHRRSRRRPCRSKRSGTGAFDSTSSDTAPAQQNASPAPAPAPGPLGAALVQRAMLVEEPPDGSQSLNQTAGRVTGGWTTSPAVRDSRSTPLFAPKSTSPKLA